VFPVKINYKMHYNIMLKINYLYYIIYSLPFSSLSFPSHPCWLLVVGCWLLVVGCWLLVVGCWLLAVGCCKNAKTFRKL